MFEANILTCQDVGGGVRMLEAVNILKTANIPLSDVVNSNLATMIQCLCFPSLS